MGFPVRASPPHRKVNVLPQRPPAQRSVPAQGKSDLLVSFFPPLTNIYGFILEGNNTLPFDLGN